MKQKRRKEKVDLKWIVLDNLFCFFILLTLLHEIVWWAGNCVKKKHLICHQQNYCLCPPTEDTISCITFSEFPATRHVEGYQKGKGTCDTHCIQFSKYNK